jgi:hypothetical protein
MGEDEARGEEGDGDVLGRYVGGDRRPRTKYYPITEALPYKIVAFLTFSH